MVVSTFEIPIDCPKEEFQKHIDIENNSRIIFSGRYGIGKTYFLKKFFDKNEAYNTFFLTPINYQISGNEDIMELIKYDILFELIEKEWVTSDDEKFSKRLALQFYLLDQSVDILPELLSVIPKLGKAVKFVKNLIPFIQGFQEYVNEIKKGDIDLAKKFAEAIENSKGLVYENDIITQLIYGAIADHKAEEKQNVLIIDDLDRIDPEHIFRLFNIFSAHFDLEGEFENKFGFDKIIFVCDIENIRNIFHAKYGQNVDFSGYIDKFYSTDCFQFSNEPAVIQSIDLIFAPFVNKLNKKVSKVIVDVVKLLIVDFINSDSINLRDLQNIVTLGDPFKEPNHFIIGEYEFDDYRYYFFKALFTLRKILGNDDQKVLSSMERCKRFLNKSMIYKRLDLISHLLPFVDLNQTILKFDDEQMLEIKEYNLKFKYKIVQKFDFHNEMDGYQAEVISIENGDQILTENLSINIGIFYFLLGKAYYNIVRLKRVIRR